MENQQPIWQKHLLLIIGVALPFALMAFVLIYQVVVVAAVPDPRYTAVYMTTENAGHNEGTFETDVVNGQLEVAFVPRKCNTNDTCKNEIDVTRSKIRIYASRGGEGTKPEIYDLRPTKEMAAARTLLPLPDALKMPMIDGTDAPDGYRYLGYYDRDRGLLNGMLVGGSRRQDRTPVLEKDSRIIDLPVTGNNRYYNVQFIGWMETPTP